ncbi:hypothetical protein BG004_007985 [Podila humilis]|nr:hypothetical protein BG004_007985 [Podila humilis]
MSTQVLTPEVAPARHRRGLASIKSIFSTKRHTIAQIPGSEHAESTFAAESNEANPAAALSPSTDKNQSSTSSSIFSNPKRSMEKAAEKEKKEQVKQAIQLSTVDEQGAFVAPPPVEKGFRDHVMDNDDDFFDTILNTPPERVQTFLSAAKTISPGMFSTPGASKIKRHTLSSFPSQWTPPPSTSSPLPMVPPKDMDYCYTPSSSRAIHSNKAHMTFITSSEDLAEALSESIGSLLSTPEMMSSSPMSSSSQDGVLPDLMMDDDEHSSSSSSTQSSPRHSTASLQQQHQHQQEQSARAMKARQVLDLGGELELPVEM